MEGGSHGDLDLSFPGVPTRDHDKLRGFSYSPFLFLPHCFPQPYSQRPGGRHRSCSDSCTTGCRLSASCSLSNPGVSHAIDKELRLHGALRCVLPSAADARPCSVCSSVLSLLSELTALMLGLCDPGVQTPIMFFLGNSEHLIYSSRMLPSSFLLCSIGAIFGVMSVVISAGRGRLSSF